jgi:hypothetical protein
MTTPSRSFRSFLSRRLTQGLAAALSLTLGQACRTTSPENTTLSATAPQDRSAELPSSLDEFFARDTLWYVRIDRWDSNLLHPDALRSDIGVEGATLTVAKADPRSGTHCPDAEITPEHTMIHTDNFTMEMTGNTTFGTPKASWRMKLRGERIFGMRSVNLKSMWNDVSQMRESLAWETFKKAGVPESSRHTWAKFCINGRYMGLYSWIEHVDKSFLDAHFKRRNKGNLYKAAMKPGDIGNPTLQWRSDASGNDSGRQYWRQADLGERTWELKTNDDPGEEYLQSYDDLAMLARVINAKGFSGPDVHNSEAWTKAVENILDVRSVLRWASTNMLLGGWDNYWKNPNNFHLYNYGRGEDIMTEPRFTWIPHDYDTSFGLAFDNKLWHESDIIDWERGQGASNQRRPGGPLPIVTNLLKSERYLRYYLDHMEFLLDTWFNSANMSAQIKARASLIRDAAILESAGDQCRRNANGSDDEAEIDQCPSHTGRQFSWFEVKHFGFGNQKLTRDPMVIEGLLWYVQLREASARRQLALLRRQHPRGSSGVTFPDVQPR